MTIWYTRRLKITLTFSLIYYLLKNFFQMEFPFSNHKKAT